MPFEVTILGSSAAIPTSKRHPSAQLVNLLGRFFLFDCGEGTQIQLRRFGVKIQKIDYICISHLHGDHYLGLIGLLSTMNLLNRTKELIIFAPDGLDEILELHFRLSYSKILFPFRIVNLKELDLFKLFEGDNFELFSFGLKHRIPCWGFKLTEKKRSRKIIPKMIKIHNIPFQSISSIKNGGDFITESGRVILNKDLTIDSYQQRSYAYCSDTKYFKALVKYVKDVDLLYHESTFHSCLASMAKSTFHSTSQDAATVARQANVKKLIIGHFSSRYKELDILKEDAKQVFKNVELALEGTTWVLDKIYN